MWKLLVRCGEAGEADIPIDGSLTVGRDAGNSIWLDDPLVSRRHARVRLRGDELLLEDLGSANGVLRNGEPVDRAAVLRAGDVLVIGSTTLLVTWTAVDATPATPSRPLDATASLPMMDDDDVSPRSNQALGEKRAQAKRGCLATLLAIGAVTAAIWSVLW